MSEPSGSDSDADPPRSTLIRSWLEYGGQTIVLKKGETTIGRAVQCEILLDDGLVSRVHAKLLVDDTGASAADAGSANGVFLNGTRLQQPTPLADGDVLRIGRQELVFRRAEVRTARPRLGAETLHGNNVGEKPATATTQDEPAPDTGMEVADTFNVLASVVDKILALGRGEEAQRMMSGTLLGFLERSRHQPIPEALADRVVLYSVRLAEATSSPRWIDYTFELFTYQRRPLPSTVVDRLHRGLRQISGVDVGKLRRYVQTLRAEQGHFGPSARFLVQRIEGLERLASL